MGWGEAVRTGENEDASARFFLSAIYPVLRYFASVCVRHRVRAFLSPLQLVGASSVERVACRHHRRSASSRLTALVRGSDRRVVSEPLCRCVVSVLLLRWLAARELCSFCLFVFRRTFSAREVGLPAAIIGAVASSRLSPVVPLLTVCPSLRCARPRHRWWLAHSAVVVGRVSATVRVQSRCAEAAPSFLHWSECVGPSLMPGPSSDPGVARRPRRTRQCVCLVTRGRSGRGRPRIRVAAVLAGWLSTGWADGFTVGVAPACSFACRRKPSPKRVPSECESLVGLPPSRTLVTWLILPVVICLSQRLSHACLSMNASYCETANGSLNQL